MTNVFLKRTLFVSLLGHLAVFSLFSFTFGNKIPQIDYASISFLGQILRSADLINQPTINSVSVSTKVKFSPLALDSVTKEYPLGIQPYLKPPVSLFYVQEKSAFIPKEKSLVTVPKKREPVIMFYPILPSHFLLYFKDRQRVHIELMFNIISTPSANTILLKRKVSSGNLEVDLLSMRYIGHYLFVQQAKFLPNQWQTVKIDLSAKND